MTWLDRALLTVAPRYALQRFRARAAAELTARYYDAASVGRRTEGWRRASGDGNAATQQGLQTRMTARDLVRNNPLAKAAVNIIVDHVIGWGIMANLPQGPMAQTWMAWAGTTACDADRRRTLNSLAKQALATVVVSGECLIRRRIRRPEDGLPIPLQIQLLEPDYLDEEKDGDLPNGGAIIQGIEYGPIGQAPVAYWMFSSHPGANRVGIDRGASQRIPAEELLYIGDPDRPGQSRSVSWFAPVMVKLKDLDDYEDAALMRQKIAACLAVLVTDADGTATPLGLANDAVTPGVDLLEPGTIARVNAGNKIDVVNPPSVSDHAPYTTTQHRQIAAGLGISYESLTGDYSQVNFSSARMSRNREYGRVHAWQWDLIIPQFYGPVWRWFAQAATIAGVPVPADFVPEWTTPSVPMIEPDREGLAYARNIRAGIQTFSDAVREQGYDPETFYREYADDLKRLDRLGIILDSDTRQTTQAGQLQGKALPEEPAPVQAAVPSEPDRATMARVERMFETLVVAKNGNGHHPPVTVNVPQPKINVDARTTVEPSNITVAPADVVIHPAETVLNIHEGAIRGGDVHVAPAEVVVDARTHVEPTNVTVEGPAQQSLPMPSPITVIRMPKPALPPAEEESEP